MQDPKKSHLDVAIQVVKYIKSESGLGIFHDYNSGLDMFSYYDLDREVCIEIRIHRILH